MEWLFDPSAWLGLLTLVILEIVLGIDNLVFIAILADKLPPHQRDKARIIGLSLALLMRLVLLSIMAHLIKLTAPLVSFWGVSFSGRDLILLTGGFFLLWKATMELHERLEGVDEHTSAAQKGYPKMWLVLVQIIILDAVFSLDAIITAVGMVEHLPVMMMAVTIAMALMVLASKPLTRFVGAHPTVVMLCLSFLLLIGFSLLAEGLGFHMPKGYLYAAIGFSILIEFFNQLRQQNLRKNEQRLPLRERQARAILRLLGEREHPVSEHVPLEEGADSLPTPDLKQELNAFGEAELHMVSGVLSLGERSVPSIMTPRTHVVWLDISDDAQTLRQQIQKKPHSMFPVCGRNGLDDVIGVGRAKDVLCDLADHGSIQRKNTLRAPLIVPESITLITLTEMLRQSRGHMALVSDEYGTILGLVTPMDLLEAIAGEFPDVGEDLSIRAVGPAHWIVDGLTDLHMLEQALGVHNLASDSDDYGTLAGLMLDRLERLPEVGQVVEYAHLRLEVLGVQDRRITFVDVTLQTLPYEDEVGRDA